MRNNKRDKLFQDIEHDKTQLRIVENRTDKTAALKEVTFPLKVYAGLTNGKLNGMAFALTSA